MNVFKGVGESSKIDHVAVQTAYGKMILAAKLFGKLGYSVNPDRKASGSWGNAIFMIKEGSVSIQLTDSSNNSKISAGENHFGLIVDDPKMVACEIQQWGWDENLNSDIEPVPGGKIFVTILGVLTMPIELVPDPRLLCPECKGKGEVLDGDDGREFMVRCGTCRGK